MKHTLTLIGILLGFAFSSLAAEASQKSGVLQVQVLVFSGRPDPVFVISDSAIINQVIALLESLPPHPTLGGDGSGASAARLGYQGMRVDFVLRGGSDIASFTVYRTAVEIAYDGKTTKAFRLDAGAKLEQRLIRMAAEKRVLPAEVLSHVKGEK